MKPTSCILSTFIGIGIFSLTIMPTLSATFSDTVEFTATSSGSDTYAKKYDGPTKQKAHYTIVLDENNQLDKAKSFVQFETVTYTSSGETKSSSWKTEKIDITDVTFTDDEPPKVKSLKFKDEEWYPPYPGLTNDGVSGELNVLNKRFKAIGSYLTPSGTKRTYTVQSIPEHTSLLSLLVIGILGGGLIVKRELTSLNSSKSKKGSDNNTPSMPKFRR